MNERLIAEVNMRCKEDDILYHVGDFCVYGRARGVEGMRKPAEAYERLIKPKLIHFRGNHDKNNKCKGSLYGAFMIFGKFQVWVQHRPPWQSVEKGEYVPENVTAYICGHVHEKWKCEWWRGKPVINVGVDVWNYRPVRKDELISYIEKVRNEKEKM